MESPSHGMKKFVFARCAVGIGSRLGAALVILLLACLTPPIQSHSKAFIDWASLRNPILEYSNWSIKDAAMVYREGVFYLFFSAFYERDGRVRSHVVEVSTKDFKTYSSPLLNFDGQEDGWIGMCSPDVNWLNGTYYMTFNSWGDKPGVPNQLFYMTSKDLIHWTPRRRLAANLTAGKRAIDAAVTFADNRYYLIWKEDRKPRLASGQTMDGEFSFVGSGYPTFHMADGMDNGLIHENYQFIKIDGRWRMLTTDYTPHNPYLYTLKKSRPAGTDWLAWEKGYKLDIVKERFNTDHPANAAALYDWRQHDGYFYLLYAGRTEGASYLGRGWNRLGLSRSKDLIRWYPAGTVKLTAETQGTQGKAQRKLSGLSASSASLR